MPSPLALIRILVTPMPLVLNLNPSHVPNFNPNPSHALASNSNSNPSILGMFLFGASWAPDDYRSNFDNIYRAFLSVFQIITLSDWVTFYSVAKQKTSFLSCLYFISLISIGNYILCNLFIGILLDSFQETSKQEMRALELRLKAEMDRTPDAVNKFMSFRRKWNGANQQYMFVIWKKKWAKASEAKKLAALKGPKAITKLKKFKNKMLNGTTQDLVTYWHEVTMNFKKYREENPGKDPYEEFPGDEILSNSHIKTSDSPTQPTQKINVDDGDGGESSDWTEDSAWFNSDNEEDEEEQVNETIILEYVFVDMERSCCMFNRVHPVRIVCTVLVNSSLFDKFILFCIMVNSLCMTIEDPSIKDGSQKRLALDTLSLIFNIVFLIEMTSKIISMGLIWGEAPYLEDPWNRLDGFLVSISWLDFIMSVAKIEAGSIIKILKILRILRALRPLRALRKFPKLLKVLNAIVGAFYQIFDTVVICALVFAVFGILSMNLFGGQLGMCTDANQNMLDYSTTPAVLTRVQCVNTSVNGTWTIPEQNFDNFANSILTLFYVATFDGWTGTLCAAMDTQGFDMTLKPNASEGNDIFFILFLIIGNYMILNIFVGVVVNTFNESGGAIAMKDPIHNEIEAEQLEAKTLQEGLDEIYYSQHGPSRQFFKEITSEGGAIEAPIMVVICLNVLCMAIEFYDQPDKLTLSLEVSSYLHKRVRLTE